MLATTAFALLAVAQSDVPPPPADRAAAGGGFYYTAPRIGAADYPRAALAAAEQGTVVLRAEIQPDGSISDCSVESSSGSAALDSASCPLFQARARFRGAGRTVPMVVRVPISWRLGDVSRGANGEPQP